MVIYVPGTEETDPKKQNMSLQQLGGATSTLQTTVAGHTATLLTTVVGPGSATDNALARFDGTTGKLVQNSEITLGDSDGKLTRPAGISLSGTNTNDNAAAGYVGEVQQSIVASGSALALTNNVPLNITSISLTAGDWDVSGVVSYITGNTSVTTYFISSISTTSATLDTNNWYLFSFNGSYTAAGTNTTHLAPVSVLRASLSGTTTYYLVAQAGFTVAGVSAFGRIYARRMR